MLSVILFIVLSLLLLVPQEVSASAHAALIVWAKDVVPSLFPYMVLSRLLSSRLRRSGLRPLPVAASLGLLGGSPTGAIVTASYTGDNALDARQLAELCALTGTISPMFFLGTLCAWTGDLRRCRLLLAVHLAAALLSALCVSSLSTSRKAKQISGQHHANPPQEDALSASVRAILSVGGCIVLFSVAARGVSLFLPTSFSRVSAAAHAVLEIAGGLHALCAAWPDAPFPLLAFQTGFGGLSILTQNLSVLRPLGVSFGCLFRCAFLRAVLSALLAFLLLPFL